MSKKLLILGENGLLGSSLKPYLISKKYHILEYYNGSQRVDLTDENNVNSLLSNLRPDIIINLIALTNVEECEKNPYNAYLLNAKVVENISNWIKFINFNKAILIHLSTDHLYDNEGPNLETNVKLSNYYAYSKYIGEKAALTIPSIILRTNFFGKSINSNRRSFTDWLYDSLTNNHKITVFNDIYFSPLSMLSLIQIIETIIQNPKIGLFNLGATNGISKANFATIFAEKLNLNSQKMIQGDSRKLIPYRPRDMRMNCNFFENTYSIKLPTVECEIENVISQYNS